MQIPLFLGFQGGSTVRNLPTMPEMWVQILSQEDPLEKEMEIHSSTLAWKILWMEEPDRLQSMGSQRVGHDWATSLSQNCTWQSQALNRALWLIPKSMFFLLNSAASCTQKNITRQFPHPEKIVILFPALSNGQGNLLCCSPYGLVHKSWTRLRAEQQNKDNVELFSLQQLVNCFCKEPDGKYLKFCRLYGFCNNYSALLL